MDRYPSWESVRSAYLADSNEDEDRIAERLDVARRWLGRSDLSVTAGLAIVRLAIPATGRREIIERRLPEVLEKTILPAEGSDGEHCWTKVELILRSRHAEQVVETLQDQPFEVEDPLCSLWFRAPQEQAPSDFVTSLLLWGSRKAGVDLVRYQSDPRGARVFVRTPDVPLAFQLADHLTAPLPGIPAGDPS